MTIKRISIMGKEIRDNMELFTKFAKSEVGLTPKSIDKQATVASIGAPVVLEERELRATAVDIFSRLLYDRIIFLSGEVNEESMDILVAQLLFLDSTDNRDINIYINSPGGDCYSGLEAVSVMDFIKSDVSTVTLGMAASMGAVIAASGAKGKRLALPYSRFMLHQPLSNFGTKKFTDSKIALEEMNSVRDDIYGILSERSGHSFDEIVHICENGDKWMKPDEAIRLGFLDGVISPRKR